MRAPRRRKQAARGAPVIQNCPYLAAHGRPVCSTS
nr:MAG TPA: hypothetical protein [Caudoviricetes sp.]